MKPQSAQREKMRASGFTVVELLIVVAVITIISTVAIFNFLTAIQKTKRSTAKSFIGKLELAISMYRIDTGLYPSDKKSSASLREALDPDEHDSIRDLPGWNGPYLEFRQKEMSSLTGELLDPWARSKKDKTHIWIYRADGDDSSVTHPPFHNTGSFDIYSKGYDGKTGTDDKDANEFEDGNYCQNTMDDDNDGIIDELNPNGKGNANNYLEDDINNW